MPESNIGAAFDDGAADFERLAPSLWNPMGNALVAAAEIEVGHRILDAGCGTGATPIPAAQYAGPGGRVDGVRLAGGGFTHGFAGHVDGPHPADKNGNSNTNASRGKPYDHVLVDADLRAYQTATVLGASSFANGLVLDSRVYTPLSEIAPVQAGDSAASNMQHMGVIKDFLVPLGGDTGTPDAGPVPQRARRASDGAGSRAADGDRAWLG